MQPLRRSSFGQWAEPSAASSSCSGGFPAFRAFCALDQLSFAMAVHWFREGIVKTVSDAPDGGDTSDPDKPRPIRDNKNPI